MLERQLHATQIYSRMYKNGKTFSCKIVHAFAPQPPRSSLSLSSKLPPAFTHLLALSVWSRRPKMLGIQSRSTSPFPPFRFVNCKANNLLTLSPFYILWLSPCPYMPLPSSGTQTAKCFLQFHPLISLPVEGITFWREESETGNKMEFYAMVSQLQFPECSLLLSFVKLSKLSQVAHCPALVQGGESIVALVLGLCGAIWFLELRTWSIWKNSIFKKINKSCKFHTMGPITVGIKLMAAYPLLVLYISSIPLPQQAWITAWTSPFIAHWWRLFSSGFLYPFSNIYICLLDIGCFQTRA